MSPRRQSGSASSPRNLQSSPILAGVGPPRQALWSAGEGQPRLKCSRSTSAQASGERVSGVRMANCDILFLTIRAVTRWCIPAASCGVRLRTYLNEPDPAELGKTPWRRGRKRERLAPAGRTRLRGTARSLGVMYCCILVSRM